MRFSILLLCYLLAVSAVAQLNVSNPFFVAGVLKPAPSGGNALLTSLVAHWKLNEASGTRDDAHAANDLTDNNTVTSATGKISDAGDFEYINLEYLSIADNADMSLGSDTDFTFAVWLNAESLGSHGAYHPVVSKTPASGGNAAAYHLYWYTSNMRFNVANGTANAEVTASYTATATWKFVVAWHSSVDNKLYLQIDNGTPAEVAWSGGTQDDTGAFEMGRFPHATTFFWDGLIDSVSFWKRVLTADERTTLYNSGAGLDYPF